MTTERLLRSAIEREGTGENIVITQDEGTDWK